MRNDLIKRADVVPALLKYGVIGLGSVDETKRAISLIEGANAEQEPRVMTLDEVLNAEDFVWAEIWTPGDRRWCLIYARIKKSIYDDILMLHEDSGFRWTRLESNYNMKGGWRCWSARPTEEQRKNTPWEGEKE